MSVQCRQSDWERDLMLDTLDEIWMHFLRVSPKHCIVGIMETGKVGGSGGAC